ncbi:MULTISPECIES: acetyl-CoA carboxylase, carboxyltransferase subunit beta [Clostridium]|uniref:Acetyl-coenzyme A carboxylase carboxyl transferase subunit beta n=1 Tax=Clostridium cibarium TaxID=2762247 RepID=A0ABR8PQU7_9CLOT|nr:MULTISPECIES: acetyl-CoA carboxylase, carboxyltransferase subunit beta [Clostridium]MBD7910545.1 acetyl-CoA carboxylase carboxyltransferase subunit beta [Clostridium cibarium]
MLKDLFKKSQYATVKNISRDSEDKPNIPSGLWAKCDKCGSIIYKEDLISNYYVCTSCKNHLRIKASTRIELFFDKGSFRAYGEEIKTSNPLKFKGYEEKVVKGKKSTDSSEAVVTGIAKVNGIEVATAVMDSFFMMGSMGSVVGERITSIVEYATENRLPLIIFTTSGGARMQEGIISLMQMAKVSAAIAKHDDAGLLYITVLTDPTTGGVTASFAMEGDIIISEPNALVGFAGRRVIEDTIKEVLPDDFQKAEFLLKKGFIDTIIDRRNLRKEIYNILSIHEVKNYG